MNVRSILGLGALILAACATTTPEGATANALAQSERIGHLEAERSAAIDLAKKERAARVEADVKVARLTYEVAVDEYNLLVTQAVCDRARGLTVDAATQAKLEAAGDRMRLFGGGCGKDEPVDACVERKAREADR